MCWKDAVEQSHPLEQDVRDIEGRQEPFVLGRRQFQVLYKTSDLCVSDI